MKMLLIGLAIVLLAADFASYKLYGFSFILGELLTVNANFNFSLSISDAANKPRSENNAGNL